MILEDSFKRRLSYLRLSVTDLCNFRCIYCLPDGYQGKACSNELSLLEIETLVRVFAEMGTRKIRLTGGEPTLRPDIHEIIAICKAQMGIETVALTTNGYMLDKKFPQFRQAGLDKINISIDGFTDDIFYAMTGKHQPEKIISTIDQILAQGFMNIKVNTVLMKKFAQQVFPQALSFIQHRPIIVRFIELMQTLDNHTLFNQEFVNAQMIEQSLITDAWELKDKEQNSGPAREYSHKDYLGGIGFITPYDEHFCISCNRLRVTSVGQLHLCLFAAQSKNIRDYLKQQDVSGLKALLMELAAVKPEHHFLHNKKSGLIHDLSMIGG